MSDGDRAGGVGCMENTRKNAATGEQLHVDSKRDSVPPLTPVQSQTINQRAKKQPIVTISCERRYRMLRVPP